MLLGIKTGSTTPAGDCLLASSNKNGFSLIAVVLGGSNTNVRFADTVSLFNYGYSTYSFKEIASQNQVVQTINVKGAANSTKKLDVLLQKDVPAVVNNSDNSDNFIPEIKLNSDLKAPLAKGDVIGTAEYKIDGTTYSSNLIASHDVKASKMFIIVLAMIVLLALLILLKIAGMNKKKKKSKSYKNHKEF